MPIVAIQGIQLGKDLIVHAVYCGSATGADAASWRTLADVARGEFAAIDLRSAPLILGPPFDAEMIELGKGLNHTYVPIGALGLHEISFSEALWPERNPKRSD